MTEPGKTKKTPEQVKAERLKNLAKGRAKGQATNKRKAAERKAQKEREAAERAAAGPADAEDAPPPPNGQPLVQVRSGGNGSSARSLEEIAAKPRESQAVAEPAVPDSPSYPSLGEIVEQTEEYSGNEAVPRPEMATNLLDAPSMEPAEAHDFVGDTPTPRGLEDLMNVPPAWEGGEWKITVERKQPKSWSGVVVHGMLPSIRRRMSRTEFINTYGGGEYILILYGPPKRGAAVDASGRRRWKVYTQPVKYTLSFHQYEPLLPEDEDEFGAEENNTMRTYQQARGPRSNADANIHRYDLEHEREMDNREDTRRREVEDR